MKKTLLVISSFLYLSALSAGNSNPDSNHEEMPVVDVSKEETTNLMLEGLKSCDSRVIYSEVYWRTRNLQKLLHMYKWEEFNSSLDLLNKIVAILGEKLKEEAAQKVQPY